MDLKKDPTDMYFRRPEVADAPFIEKLVKDSPPLDLNSLYCYLILCAHFSRTSVVACDADAVCGFISAYLRPDEEDTLFVWQVAVDKKYRGKGVARSMLSSILNRPTPCPLS